MSLRILHAFNQTATFAAITTMAVLVVVVSTQVILRYVFNASLDWAWELSRLCFVATIFFGIPLALKEKQHVGIDALQSLLPEPLRRGVVVTLNVIVMLLMFSVAGFGITATLSTWDQTLSSMPISTGWFYVPVLWSAVHCILILIQQTVSDQLGAEPAGGGDV